MKANFNEALRTTQEIAKPRLNRIEEGKLITLNVIKYLEDIREAHEPPGCPVVVCMEELEDPWGKLERLS